jgi:CheY-like chemotaxis protein
MKKSILVVDDNDDIRESTSELLTLEGFNVIVANSGNEAIIQIKINLPDLIICDIVMPGISGFDLLRILRQNFTTKFIPFIFSTAQSESISRQKAKDLGIIDYLVKPFDNLELIKCIERALCTSSLRTVI